MHVSNKRGLALLYMCAVSIAIAGSGHAREPFPRFAPLIDTSKTTVDEPIVYPGGTAKLTTGILTLAPGEETGWHTHSVPLTGLVLSGAITVDYGDKGTKTYAEGQSIAEAMGTAHNGRNLGTVPVRVFVVVIGAEGIAATTPVKR